MKSVITGEVAKKSDYPKLMGSLDGTVILFSGWEAGTVVHEGSGGDEPMGMASSSWDMSYFTDYSGSVTLSNGG